MKTEPRAHEFRLILDGPDFDELPESAWDRLYESGCDDATIGQSGGVWSAVFHREAPTLAEAIASAIRSIEAARVGLRVVRVEAGDPDVSTGEIAERAGVSREAVRLWATRRVGPGGFPGPITGAGGRRPVYRWSEVARWLATLRGEPLPPSDESDALEYVNARLRLRALAGRLGPVRAAVDQAVKVPARKG